MTDRPLDVKAAEKRAKLGYWGKTTQDFIALLALARELAVFVDRNDDEQHADERHALLAKAREAGLLESTASQAPLFEAGVSLHAAGKRLQVALGHIADGTAPQESAPTPSESRDLLFSAVGVSSAGSEQPDHEFVPMSIDRRAEAIGGFTAGSDLCQTCGRREPVHRRGKP